MSEINGEPTGFWDWVGSPLAAGEIVAAVIVTAIFFYWQSQSGIRAADAATFLGLLFGYLALRIALNQLRGAFVEIRRATARLSRQNALVALQSASAAARDVKGQQDQGAWPNVVERYTELCVSLTQLYDPSLALSLQEATVLDEAINDAQTIVRSLDRPNVDTLLTEDQRADLAARSMNIRLGIARISARLRGVVE